MPRWASSFAAIASWTDSAALAGSPLPPSSRQVARENWYLPRYRPLRRDRGRVAAGLAARDPRERGRGAAAGSRAEVFVGADGRDAERAERRRAGDAVHGQAVGALEAAHGTPGDRAEGAVGRHAERALEGDDGAAAGARLERAAARARGGHGAARAVGGDGRAGDQGHGREQGGRPAAADPLSPGSLERPRHDDVARRAATRARGSGSRDRIWHSYLLGLGAYGVSCRARAKTCATPRSGGDSPREPSGSNRVPRSPPLVGGDSACHFFRSAKG